MYRTEDANGRYHESDRLKDLRGIAESRLMGLPYDGHVMIEEWQEEGFWEPAYRVERDSRGRVVCR